MLVLKLIMAGAMLCNPAPGACMNPGANNVQELSAQGAKPALSINASDLKKLKWIEGTWRGTGDVEQPFYERYYFENESTLVVESFSDETLSKVTDVTRFDLKDGQFGNRGEGSRWAATELKEGSITFEPVVRARNSFLWERESNDVWRAVIKWPAAEGKPARQRVYRMERLPAVKR